MVARARQMIGNVWRGRRWRTHLVIVVIVAAIIAGFVVMQRRGQQEAQEAAEKVVVLPEVEVRAFGELVAGATFDKVATFEAAESAPLVARTGGRVSEVVVQLGGTTAAGQVVVAIDGNGEANPAQAQLDAAAASLGVFRNIEQQALASADLGVATAQLGLEAAEAGEKLSALQVATGLEQADLSVRQAELNLQDAKDADQSTDILIRGADIALKAARLAQDQAVVARRLSVQTTGDAVKQAAQALSMARQAKTKLTADLASQRVGIEGQVAAASEQVALAQVTAPLSGQVVRLDVAVGDWVRPGQEIGELNAFAGARVVVDVPTGVREKLSIGQVVTLKADGQEFSGEVVRLADGPRGNVPLWQVDILVTATPFVIHPGELVTVRLPVGPADSKAAFIPLDAVTVRQGGVVLFTVDGEGIVQEHAVAVVAYTSDFVEATVDLMDEAMVVVTGNRILRAGDQVRVPGS